MLSNVVSQWEPRETSRTKIAVVFTPNWNKGHPINPKIPKYLVWIHDKWIDKKGCCPADTELPIYANSLPLLDLKNLIDAFDFKERHNEKNLKNPEYRHIEEYLVKIYEERQARGERI